MKQQYNHPNPLLQLGLQKIFSAKLGGTRRSYAAKLSPYINSYAALIEMEIENEQTN